MPPLNPLCALFLLAFPAGQAQDELGFRVAPGTTLARTLANTYAMKLDSMTLRMNGAEVPSEAFGPLEIDIEHAENYVVTDLVAAVAEARPTRLVRTFERLTGQEHGRFSGAGGDENDERAYQSALEGKQVVFTWNAAQMAYDKAFGAEEGHGALLAALEEDMDLRFLLPPHPVSAGDSWSIDPRAFKSILDPGGDLALHAAGGEDTDTSFVDAQLHANLSGTFSATYRGTLSEDGLRLARIELRVDTRTHAEEPMPEDDAGPGGSGTNAVETTFALAGELRWDLAHGHAAEFELSGANELTMIQTVRGELEGESIEQVQRMAFKGQMSFSMSIQRR